MPDPTSWIQFSKEGPDRIVQNWSRSDLDGLAKVCLNSSGLKTSWCAGISGFGFWQDATRPLPVSLFQIQFLPLFHRRPGYYCAKPARIRFSSGWLCQVLAKRIRSGSKPVYKSLPARCWPVLPSRSGPDANRIRHVYWVCFRLQY